MSELTRHDEREVDLEEVLGQVGEERLLRACQRISLRCFWAFFVLGRFDSAERYARRAGETQEAK